MTAYQPPAVRFFLTNGEVSGLPGLKAYDPTTSNGPLHFDGSEWWWNGNSPLKSWSTMTCRWPIAAAWISFRTTRLSAILGMPSA
ncbi:hypothetical protein [Brevundimonas sp. DWR2-3-1b1]|uniref:hypothetical protein n=1 Tax=unclassified Brevundimonas TaxID=2622653 RepID=UPI003CF30EC6